MMEHFFGASNINAIAGNGGLSLGISPFGDLAVMTWPSPSYTDQVTHIASNALDVRDGGLMQAHEAMGATIGLVYRTADATEFAWIRGAQWTRVQGYADPDAAVIETRHEHAALGLAVVVTDFVPPQRDVWVRNVEVVRGPGSAVEAVEVIWYSNFAPTVSRVPQLPLADWAYDAYNDFAALYDKGRELVVHFRPSGHGDIDRIGDLIGPPPIDYGVVGEALAAGTVDATAAAALLADLDDFYGPGVYLSVGASLPVAGYQIGYDETPLCAIADTLIDNVVALEQIFPTVSLPLDPEVVETLRCDETLADIIARNGWMHTAADAFADAADGQLGHSPAAAGRVNEALRVTPAFVDDRAAVTFWVGVADTAADSVETMQSARQAGYANVYATTVEYWRTWIEQARLPDTDDARVLEVCRRALINLKVGTDRDTGAIVASLSRQAPYGQDWPRDGAFFNTALDLAGYTEMVTAHNRFYLDTIRREPAEAELFINNEPPPDPDDPLKDTFPAWSWEMNYYADGMVGGNIRFEIDNTGLAVWSLVAHVGFLPQEARQDYLQEIWPVVRNAADLLARWRDPETGLQALANEDDNYAYTQTLHGAVTVYAGLVSAARAARQLGHVAAGERYEARAYELKRAVEIHLYDPESGLFKEGLEQAMNPEMAKAGPSGWMVWPAWMFDSADPRVVRQIQTNLETSLARLDPVDGGGAYLTKLLIAAALSQRDDAEVWADVERALQAMVNRVVTPDTHVLGEVFVPVDTDGDGVNDAFSTRVSNPHLWAATLIYLTAMALYDPELFDPHLEVLPPLQEPTLKAGGCGCRAALQMHPIPARRVVDTGSVGGAKRSRAGGSRSASPMGRSPIPWPWSRPLLWLVLFVVVILIPRSRNAHRYPR
jgi:hypothetical protein